MHSPYRSCTLAVMTNTTVPALLHSITHVEAEQGIISCTCGTEFHTFGNLARTFEAHVESAEAIRTAEVGDFATYSIGGDRYPVEIIARTAKSFTTRGASTIRTHSAYAEQPEGTFVVESNPNGSIRKFTLRRDGALRSVGAGYDRLTLGRIEERFDPSF